MINVLTGLGYGIVAIALVIGIGLVVLASIESTVSTCPTGFVFQNNGTATFTTGLCCLTGGDCVSAGNTSTASTAATELRTIYGYLGTGSGGLASFIPLVIIIVIGLLFLGMFMNRKGKTYG